MIWNRGIVSRWGRSRIQHAEMIISCSKRLDMEPVQLCTELFICLPMKSSLSSASISTAATTIFIVEPMFYDYLLEAESVAKNNQTGLHSLEVPSPKNIVDLSSAHAWESRSFLNHLYQRKSRPMAIVDFVFCGDTFKLRIPTQQCAITFSFSGVQCPGRNEGYGEKALDFMRRSIHQHDVQVQVDFMDNSGTFFGSLWESETNLAVTLLQGLTKLIDSFNVERISQGKILVKAQKRAREQKLKVWENYREGKEILKVLVTENVGGGEFYVNFSKERNNLQKICQQMNAFGNNPPPLAGFQPKRGDSVSAQYGLDKS